MLTRHAERWRVARTARAAPVAWVQAWTQGPPRGGAPAARSPLLPRGRSEERLPTDTQCGADVAAPTTAEQPPQRATSAAIGRSGHARTTQLLAQRFERARDGWRQRRRTTDQPAQDRSIH